jgi:hypothetical protein
VRTRPYVKKAGRGRPVDPIDFQRVQRTTTRQPCIIAANRCRNVAGYVLTVPTDGTKDRARSIHRLAWQSKHGPIPKGYEIDHICGQRDCCNRSHLRLLTTSDHKRITAAYRYAERLEFAWCLWTSSGQTMHPKELAEVCKVKPKTAEGWVQKWKREG